MRKIEEKRLAEEEKIRNREKELAEKIARRAEAERQREEDNRIWYGKQQEKQKKQNRIDHITELIQHNHVQIMIAYGAHTETINKKSIYNAYILLRTYYLDKLKAEVKTEEDLDARVILTEKIDKMYNKVAGWSTVSTYSIERQLKDVEAIEKIILE